MQLLSAWKDSLKLLLPKNFILFFGAVLIGIMRTYRTWLRMWWWLILILGALCIPYGFKSFVGLADLSIVGFFRVNAKFSIPPTGADLIGIAELIVYIICLFTLFLSARPSLAQKTYSYYRAYVWHAVWFTGLFLLATKSANVLIAMMIFVTDRTGISSWVFLEMIIVLVGILAHTSTVIFTVFFLLDSSGSLNAFLRSVLRALMMTVGSFPLVILGIMSIEAVRTILDLIIYMFALERAWGAIYFMLLPVPISFFATLYTKRLYDNSALYLE
jgi:hypothetical protein